MFFSRRDRRLLALELDHLRRDLERLKGDLHRAKLRGGDGYPALLPAMQPESSSRAWSSRQS